MLKSFGVPNRLLYVGRPGRVNGSFWTRPINHLEVLELARNNYRQAIKQVHPDMAGGCAEQAKKVNTAWQIIEKAFKRRGIELALVLLCVTCGCVTKRTASVTPIEDRGQATVLRAIVPPMPRAMAVAPVKPRKDGVVSLAWDNGDPAETTISNLTTGAAFDAGTSEAITLGGLEVGRAQTFVAANVIGESNTEIVVPASDTNTLTQVPAWRWNGPAGILQANPTPTSAGVWTNVGNISANGVYVVTNPNAPRLFYRVKIQ